MDDGSALRNHILSRFEQAQNERNAAAAYLLGRSFTGFPAWVLWLVVHISNLIGFRNRLFVLVDWDMDFFCERAVRLILASCRKCSS
jgi:NADH dehydrogenase FAD-containing subunit